jgi:branched-chain amino acid transport system ATP-binding protein
MVEPLLRIETISKRFGGLLAVENVSFDVVPGRITALIGPNGAGKTTLFSIISGFLAPDAGRVVFGGANITGEPPHRLARRGIARTFQIVQPFAGLTVRENIAVGAHLSRPRRAEALAAAAEVARAIGLGAQLEQPAATLTVAGRKRLELARALAIAPKLLLLDEVLAGLNPSEIRDMVPVIRSVAERGVTILMIEHVMQAVMNLAEQEITADRRVIEAYLGHGAASRMTAANAADAGHAGSANV